MIFLLNALRIALTAIDKTLFFLRFPIAGEKKNKYLGDNVSFAAGHVS